MKECKYLSSNEADLFYHLVNLQHSLMTRLAQKLCIMNEQRFSKQNLLHSTNLLQSLRDNSKHYFKVIRLLCGKQLNLMLNIKMIVEVMNCLCRLRVAIHYSNQVIEEEGAEYQSQKVVQYKQMDMVVVVLEFV